MQRFGLRPSRRKCGGGFHQDTVLLYSTPIKPLSSQAAPQRRRAQVEREIGLLSLALRDAGEAQPAFQLLIYPATDMRATAPSHRLNAQGYLLTADSISYYRKQYMPDPGEWADWRASPLLASDHSKLAPALVLTAGFDPLRDEGRQYADALSGAGVPTQFVCFERQVHGFITMGRVIQEANLALDLCAAALRRGLG